MKALWARRLIREKVAAELEILRQKSRQQNGGGLLAMYSAVDEPWTADNLPPDPSIPEEGGDFDGVPEDAPKGPCEPPPERKVCIVGAGVAGLYIAMILDSLEIPNLTYDILEANDRVGGRAYTHHFSNKKHDYYDIGAMRYPDIPTMKRTFDLFRMKSINLPLIPYYLKSSKTPSLFNDRFFAPGPDPYHVSAKNGGSVPDDVVDNVDTILKAAFGPYKKQLAKNFKKGFEALKKVDDFSTREFLKRGGPDGKQPHYDFFAIQWMETQNTSTNLFDQAFSESVLDSFDFDYPLSDDDEDGDDPKPDPKPDPPQVQWYCIDGGTSLLTDAMRDGLSTKVQTGKRVEAIAIDRKNTNDGNMSVKCAGEKDPRRGYSTVFSTTTLGCLGRMDLHTLELHPSQKDAIRSLHYDSSVKVAIKFTYPWWIVDCGITEGGVASTDLSLRTCVYPSYNLHDGNDQPAVLLASYTWAQDATRLGSLVHNDNPTPANEAELVELILQDLVRLHAQHNITYDKLRAAYHSHHAYAWSHDPTTAGAFALFAPGQYSNFYPYLSRPAADSKFHIVGEASSAHHAWIVGALESAHGAVYKFLKEFKLWDAMEKLVKVWGPVPDEVETGREGTVHLQLFLGKLREEDQYRV